MKLMQSSHFVFQRQNQAVDEQSIFLVAKNLSSVELEETAVCRQLETVSAAKP